MLPDGVSGVDEVGLVQPDHGRASDAEGLSLSAFAVSDVLFFQQVEEFGGGLELGEPVGHVMSKRELSRGQ